MDVKSQFGIKLSNLLFLEINAERTSKIFNASGKETIYVPIKSSTIIDKIKSGESMDRIPVGYFIEGMYFVLGADRDFKFNHIYERILKDMTESMQFVKGKIAEEVKNNRIDDAYILLKGLVTIEPIKENYDKLLVLLDELRMKDNEFKNEELMMIAEAKKIQGCMIPYFYECLINKDDGDFVKALYCINEYLNGGGEQSSEVLELKNSLKDSVDYDKAKELVYEAPKEALEILLPMVEQYGDDAIIYYYIAVACRNLQNFEKAIFYLNEALTIDSALVQVINELGVNYASLGDFEQAIAYFRKAFEATRSVEICTNLIMCYLNSGDMEQAKLHLEIAAKLDSEDEVVIELQNYINGKKS